MREPRKPETTPAPPPSAAAPWRIIAAIAALVCAVHARAQESEPVTCATPQIHLAQDLPARWSEAVGRLCSTLAQRRDLDPQAELEISPAREGWLHLSARLRDGRSTERDVDSDAALAATAEALLLLPIGAAPQPIAAEPAPLPAAVAKPSPEPELEPDATEAPVRARESLVHLRIGANLIGHVAGTPAYIGGGFSAVAGLRILAVFIEVAPQWEAEQVSSRVRLTDFEMHNFGISAMLGLRVWDTPEGAIETGAGALFLAESQTYRPVAGETGGTLIDGQLAVFARILWGTSALRWVARIDMALALARLAKEAHIRENFPSLPSFAVGVAFGVHWEST